MIQVNIRNIELVNNPAKFDDDYHFRIKFEAIAPLAEGEHRSARRASALCWGEGQGHGERRAEWKFGGAGGMKEGWLVCSAPRETPREEGRWMPCHGSCRSANDGSPVASPPAQAAKNKSLTADLEWRLIYVGSAKSEEYDQELDSCMGEYSASRREDLLTSRLRSHIHTRPLHPSAIFL